MEPTERDLIIQQGAAIENLCDMFKEFKINNEAEHKEIFEKLDKITDGKVSNKLFFWVLGFIILFLFSLSGFTGMIKNDVTKNTVCIEKLEKAIK